MSSHGIIAKNRNVNGYRNRLGAVFYLPYKAFCLQRVRAKLACTQVPESVACEWGYVRQDI